MAMRDEARREGGREKESAELKVWVVRWRRDLTCWSVRRRSIACLVCTSSACSSSDAVLLFLGFWGDGASSPAVCCATSCSDSKPLGTNLRIALPSSPSAEVMASTSPTASPRRSSTS